MKNFVWVLLILTTFWSCGDDAKLSKEIAAIPVELEVDRFDLLFASSNFEDLSSLKKGYPYLFSNRYDDAYWKAKFSDTLELEINTEVAKVFPDFEEEREALGTLFKHILYYYPETKVPKVITVTSKVEYENKVILADSLLLVALDTYLGPEHHFYASFPRYKAKTLDRFQLDVDVAAAFAKAKVLRSRSFSLLDAMIYEGKKLYIMEQLLSTKPIHAIFGYTPEEYEFALNNEVNIWEYFVSKELLYQTDRKLSARFIDPAPFSKFNLELDADTPGRLGRYIGYKIVASYMKSNDVPMKTMLNQTADVIFAKAKYKP